MNIPVVYEDNWIIVLDKPSGLLTIPAPNQRSSRTLTSILDDDAQEKGLSHRFHPCHRLDRETSGLIIYAKGKSTQQKFLDMFARREIKKHYLAFVSGTPSPSQGSINKPIEGRQSVTKYRTIEKRKGFSVLEVQPLTGRTNQIRIHFKSIGHPILGEARFAFRRDFAIKAKRLCLHAKALEFTHPCTGKAVKIDSGTPQDLEAFLDSHPE